MVCEVHRQTGPLSSHEDLAGPPNAEVWNGVLSSSAKSPVTNQRNRLCSPCNSYQEEEGSARRWAAGERAINHARKYRFSH